MALKGVQMEEFGPAVTELKRFDIPVVERTGKTIKGAVIYIDRFGNAIINITEKDLADMPGAGKAEIGGHSARMLKHYSQAGDGELCCLVNSSGYLEVFVKMKSAAGLFGIKKGDGVDVTRE